MTMDIEKELKKAIEEHKKLEIKLDAIKKAVYEQEFEEEERVKYFDKINRISVKSERGKPARAYNTADAMRKFFKK